MCGITGIFLAGSQDRSHLAADHLARMTDALAHRGPDDRGVHIDLDAGIALGHRRLSIIDLSALGHQPMSNEDGSCWIIFNGEIYNHAELRAELRSSGVRFQSRTDTEVILRLFEAEGIRCIYRLNGMFAFAIWDGRTQELLLVRDRLGVKPLFWTNPNGKFLFASEVRALLQHPCVTRELDDGALWQSLTFLSAPAPRTHFRRIYKLAAGHWMAVSRGGVQITRWWTPLRSSPTKSIDLEEAATTVRTLLSRSIRDRMMSDVPVGVFLSGGIDSSANVALMAESTTSPINTFTVGYESKAAAHLNEFRYASQIARLHGTNHHEITLGSDAMMAFLPTLVEILDEPLLDPVCVPLHFVSRLARESGVKVIQVGEGSDELFLGYPSYLQTIRFQRRLGWLKSAPGWIRHLAAGPIADCMRLAGKVGLNRAADWARLVKRAALQEVFWGGAIRLDDDDNRVLMPTLRDRESSWSTLQPHYAELSDLWPAADIAQRMTYIELMQRLPELLLARIDRITMATSLEAREPFLDHRLVEYVLGLPASLKLYGGKSKGLLKHAVVDLLPRELVDRPKQGFPAPVLDWSSNKEFGKLLRHTVLTSPLAKVGLLDRDAVRHLVERHFGRRGPGGGVLWSLFCLTLWYRRWILAEGDPTR